MSDVPLQHSTISLPTGFEFGQVSPLPKGTHMGAEAPPSLGPLAAFQGEWKGSGFNTIFRPQSPDTPTTFSDPVNDGFPKDNVLELNLTIEDLSFSRALGSVPNRGTVQADAFLNGVSYLQAVNDVTNGGPPIGIHVEPGLWMAVPPTTAPTANQTVVRMASIPHGTTIHAQGGAIEISGPPAIPAVSIQPFSIGGAQGATNTIPRFPSQTAANRATARIPQDLTSFIAAGTITQAMLDDPNSILRTHISNQKIIHTTQINIATAPTAPLFGGGTDNIAFLLGDDGTPLPAKPNAHAVQMTAMFWIETVEQTIMVPAFKLGSPPLLLKRNVGFASHCEPIFSVSPPIELNAPRSITIRFTQIQYTQTVLLNFANLSWPHVSVATLVPSQPIIVPSTVWD